MTQVATWVTFGIVLFAAGYAVGRQVEAEGPPTASGAPTPCAPRPLAQVVAYYFHPRVRTERCETMEAAAEDAIRSGFPEQVASEAIVWQTASLDDAWNRDFVDRYALGGSSLVLVGTFDGKETGHRVCRRLEELVGDEGSLAAYVRAEVEAALDAWGPGSGAGGG